MAIRKYAALSVVEAELHSDSTIGSPTAPFSKGSVAKFGSFAFKPRPGYIYPRVRAISARINKNFDGFPSAELQKAAHTFHGRPVFVNHNNQDPERTRGVILASQYHGLAEDPHITILPEVDALTFPDLARDIIKGDMDSVSMGCDVDNSTCSYCGNVATTAEEFCDHILNNKGQELTKLVNGQPQKILVYEICRGLNFFEISFVFDPADETAVMQEVIVPDGVKMASVGGPDHDGLTGIRYENHSHGYIANDGTLHLQRMVPVTSYTTTSGGGLNVTSSLHMAYGEMIAPPKVNTLRDDDSCPQCNNEFNGIECANCGYITPPEELQDPDTEKAGNIRDDEGDDSDGDNGDLDYFGDGDEDSDDEDEDDAEEDEDDDEPNPYDLYRGQPRKEGNVSRGTAVQANVGQALAQRRLAEAQRRLRALGDNYDTQGGKEDIASPVPGAQAPAEGSDETVAAPDFSTTVENLDQEAPAGDYGTREQVMSSTRRRAEDNSAEAAPDYREDVEAPVSGQTDARAEETQYSGWDNNAQNQPQGGGDSSSTSTVVPDGRGSAPRTSAIKEEKVILKSASASQVYQLADLYNELGLVPREHRYAAIAEIEKMPAMVAEHTIKVLGRVKEVFATQTTPQGRVARTAGAIPALGKTASARTPSMARQAESRRMASSAEDTLLFF